MSYESPDLRRLTEELKDEGCDMIHADQVAAELGFRTDKAQKFCEDLLTMVNLHTVAGLLVATRIGDYVSAHRLIEIHQAIEHGPLFGPDAERIAAEREAIFDKLEAAAEAHKD